MAIVLFANKRSSERPSSSNARRPEEEEVDSLPAWLKPLLAATFFLQCKLHAHVNSQKSECKMYCLDCINGPLCSICLAYHHRGHRSIQIRKSSYHDVTRVSEIQKFIDVGGVQTYVINNAKVVFLNKRPQPRPSSKGVTKICQVCHRALLDTFRFCSIGCKVVGTSKNFTEREKQQPPSWLEHQNLKIPTPLPPVEAVVMDTEMATPSSEERNQSSAKRRKGIPHRAPMSGLIIGF